MNRRLLFLLLLVVAAAAAVLSFDALRELAELCGFRSELSWLLPVVVDAGAAAASIVWLARWTPIGATLYGRALALTLLISSVGGNALAHGLTAAGVTAAHWGIVVGVSAVAPAVLASLIHLMALVAQPDLDPDRDPPTQPADGLDLTAEFRPIPLPASDEDLIADALKWEADRARLGADRPSRDDMIEGYSIGAGRARKLRRALRWADPVDPEPTAPDHTTNGAAAETVAP